MIDLYSILDWSVLCAEVVKLRIERAERGKVIALPLAKAVGDNRSHATAEDQVLATPLATPDHDPPRIAVGDGFRRRDSKTGKMHASTCVRRLPNASGRRTPTMRHERVPIRALVAQHLAQGTTSSGRSRRRSRRPPRRGGSTSSRSSRRSSPRVGSRARPTSCSFRRRRRPGDGATAAARASLPCERGGA